MFFTSRVIVAARLAAWKPAITNRGCVRCRAEDSSKPSPKDRSADSAFSEEELARLAALKQSKANTEKEGAIQGAISEIGLIDWPKPSRAAIETLYVLAMVIGASAFLFALNTVLTEVSKQLY